MDYPDAEPKLIVKDGAFYVQLPPLTDEELEEGMRLWMEDYRGRVRIGMSVWGDIG